VLPEASIGVGEFSTLVSLKGGGFLGYQNEGLFCRFFPNSLKPDG
jgi:hypothetical protein